MTRVGVAGGAVVALGRATGERFPLRRVVLVSFGVGVQVGVWVPRAARGLGLVS